MIAKELRALAPTWLAIAAVMVAAPYGSMGVRGLGAPAYFIGAIALGAQGVGHEFTHRTWTMLLSQPVRRQRMLLVKLGVLAALLIALAALAAFTLPFGRDEGPFKASLIVLPAALAFFVAPWLTMAARSPLAGTVFPTAIAGIMFTTGNWLGVRLYGYTREVDAFRVAFMWWTMSGLCATGAVMTWWTFHRLQVTDGGGTGLDIGRRAAPAAGSSRAAFRKRSRGWMLLTKELHLHQLAFVVSGVYAASYVLIVLTLASPSNDLGDSLGVVAIFYGGVLSLLVGALASAEERQFGVHEWQQLMPMPAWQQWVIKAGTALTLALVLGIGVPLLLLSFLPPEQTAWPRPGWPMRRAVTVILFAIVTTGGLYVSSVTRSGLWALTLSIPVMMGAATFFAWVSRPIELAVYGAERGRGLGLSLPAIAGNTVFTMVFIALLGMVLWFGLANQRSSELSLSRTARQVAWMAAWTVVGLTAVLVLGAI